MKITEVKNTARVKLSGKCIKCCSSSLLYFIIIALITYFQTLATNKIENSIVLAIVQAILLLINWVFGYGIVANILDLTNDKTSSITDFINSTIKNSVKYTKIGLRVLLKILIPLLIFLFTAFYWVGTQIARINKINFLCFNQNLTILASFVWALSGILLLYYILKYTLIAYIYYENPNLSEKEIADQSNNLMKKNIGKFILLLLSFLHWFLLAAIILLILNLFIEIQYLTPFAVLFYSILRPYFVVSKSEFYNELNDVKIEEIKKDDSK